jgi:hypothetical protein
VEEWGYVKPRFADGTKVRIRTRDVGGLVTYRELERYQNLTGVVLSSKEVVAYVLRPITIIEKTHSDQATTLYVYTVKLEEGLTLYNLTEHSLEEI